MEASKPRYKQGDKIAFRDGQFPLKTGLSIREARIANAVAQELEDEINRAAEGLGSFSVKHGTILGDEKLECYVTRADSSGQVADTFTAALRATTESEGA